MLLPEDRQPTLDASGCDDDANEFDDPVRELDDVRHRGGSNVSEADIHGALAAFDALVGDNT
jgi:hypothetical protein